VREAGYGLQLQQRLRTPPEWTLLVVPSLNRARCRFSEGVTLLHRIRAMGALVADPLLFTLVLGMSVFGVVMIYSAGVLDVPANPAIGAWRRQVVWLGVSLILAVAVLITVPMRWLERLAIPAYLGAVAMLVAVLFIGTGHGPAAATQRWLQVGPMLVQPAQFANLAAVLLLARMIGRWRSPPRSVLELWKPIMVVAVPSLLVMMQPDLGTALVFGAVLLAALYWGGTPTGIIFLLLSPFFGLLLAFEPWMFSIYMVGLIAFVVFYPLKLWDRVVVLAANLAAGTVALPLWESLAPYQRNRIIVFMDPTIDPRGAGYQLIQSQVAIGSGQLTGQGLLEGSQKRLAFLPEQHTDFIFAVIGEELGFIGGLAVVAAFALILWRLVRIAERTPDPFAGILVFGIFAAWATHVMVNVGMTIGVMPITGIPLPFLSYGGSFMMVTFIALALAQRIAAEYEGRAGSSTGAYGRRVAGH
jgi:rod shape determining protein RodA